MSDRFAQAFHAAASLLEMIRELQELAHGAQVRGITSPTDDLVRAVDWFRQAYIKDWREIEKVDNDLTRLHGRTDSAVFEGEPNAHRLVLQKAEQVMRCLRKAVNHEPGFHLNCKNAAGGVEWRNIIEDNLPRICRRLSEISRIDTETIFARCKQEYLACAEGPDGPGDFRLDGLLFTGLTKQQQLLLAAIWNTGLRGKVPIEEVWRQGWPREPNFDKYPDKHTTTLKKACDRLAYELGVQSGGRVTAHRSKNSVELVVRPAPTIPPRERK